MSHPNTVTAIRDGAAYTLLLPDTRHLRTAYKVNGVFVDTVGDQPHALPRPDIEITLDAPPVVERYEAVDVQVAYRSLTEGVSDLTVAEYEAECQRLLARRVSGPEGGLYWSDVADEVAYQRLLRGYRAETRTDWIKAADVLVAVRDQVRPEPFVTPKRLLGGDYASAVVVYDRMGFMVDRLRARLAKLGLTEEERLFETGRKRYKIFTSNNELSLHLPGGFHRKEVRVATVTDQFERVRALKDADAALVEGWMTEWSVNLERPVNTLEVMEELRRIGEAIQAIDAKIAGADAKRNAQRRVSALIDKLRGADDIQAA